MNEYKCPLCQSPMKLAAGDSINPDNGITIYCNNPLCPPHENVNGHGKDAKSAYEIACQKFIPAGSKKY